MRLSVKLLFYYSPQALIGVKKLIKSYFKVQDYAIYPF